MHWSSADHNLPVAFRFEYVVSIGKVVGSLVKHLPVDDTELQAKKKSFNILKIRNKIWFYLKSEDNRVFLNWAIEQDENFSWFKRLFEKTPKLGVIIKLSDCGQPAANGSLVAPSWELPRLKQRTYCDEWEIKLRI